MGHEKVKGAKRQSAWMTSMNAVYVTSTLPQERLRNNCLFAVPYTSLSSTFFAPSIAVCASLFGFGMTCRVPNE